MTIASRQHLSEAEIDDFLSGRLSGDAFAKAEAHLSHCNACCSAMANRPEDAASRRLRATLRSASSAPATRSPVAHDEVPQDLRDHPRYRVVRLIGAGGMGRVYLAEHRLMERTVALKVIDRRVMGHPSAAARFAIEVKAAAKLDHPNIVRAFDAEQAGSTHFLVMEYVDGMSLARLVRERGPLSLSQACQCIRQAALGLQHAADHGMVHRDIKPENLMLTRKGQVKILDFGLARLARETGEANPSTDSAAPSAYSTLTAVGSVFGTPAYIAPEQARDSGDVDIRADLYSLGCTLHFLLTGRVPAPLKTTSQHSKAATSVTLDAETLPTAMVPILRRMTAANPTDRYQTPSAVAEALTPFCRKSTNPTGIRNRRRFTIFIAATAAAAAMLAIGVIWMSSGKPTDSSTGATATPSTQRAAAGYAPMASPPRMVGRPAVLIVLPPRYHHDDYFRVRGTLEQRGVRVFVASVGPCSPETGGAAGSIEPDLRIDLQPPNPADYDAIYFPGGHISPYKDEGRNRSTVWMLIDRMRAEGKPIAALGHGQGVLAVKGDLAQRTVAANNQLRGWMPGYAARISVDRVALDGPYLTGSESSDAEELASRLATLLKN